MKLEEGIHRLTDEQVEILQDAMSLKTYSSISYRISDIDQAFKDYLDSIDSYESLCTVNEGYFYTCQFDIGIGTGLFIGSDITIHLILYKKIK
jgi:hypothetical protein